jgi:hypothetical protein
MTPTKILGVIFLGTCAIILCGGLVAGRIGFAEMALGIGCLVLLGKVVDRFSGRREEGGLSAAQAARLEERLAEVERRLTDVQEVQIALSEKSELWQQERAGAREG